MYTDGVTEAFNVEKEEFSEERLQSAIAAHSHDTPKEMITSVLEKVNAFSEGMPQSDDITLLVLKYSGNKGTM